MAKKTIKVSDKSGREIEEGRGATVRIVFDDARRGSYELDVTVEEADEYTQGARKVARRGRRPASAV
jgi:hypothetical protein